jgi:hypothetical protein
MSADFEQVMAQCSRGCFTGLLRVRTPEGNGEVRFLSGIQDGIRFDSVEGDEALERLLSASDPEFEAVSSLPPIDLVSTEPVPPEGGLDRYHAAQLMRYCESNSLTCALELEVQGRMLTARYRLGELLSVEPDSEHTSRLAEARVGLYRFRLPRFELPANVQQRRSVPAAAAKAAAAAAKPAPVPAPVAVKPVPAPAPVAVKPAPAPSATKPAPAAPAPAAAANAPAAAKPAAAVAPAAVAPAPAAAARPAAAKPTPASLAETPLVAIKPVAIITPVAGSVGGRGSQAAAKPPASPPAAAPSAAPAANAPAARAAAARPAAEARPSPARSPSASLAPAAAASNVRREGPRLGPSAVTPQPGRTAERAGAAQPPAVVYPASVAPPPSVASHPPPRSPAPSAPPGPGRQSKPAPLQGLWTDAVKPPPQSAPLELDGGRLRVGAAGGANKAQGRAEGLSSLAYTPTDVPAASNERPRASSLLYWLVAIALLIVVAVVGWLAFGR